MKKKQKYSSQKGASLLEYAVLVSMISIVAIASVQALGRSIDATLGDVTDQLTASGGLPTPG